MKIAIDVRPLSHKPAGIGHYVAGLLDGLNQLSDENQYYLYSSSDWVLPKTELTFGPRFIKKIIPGNEISWYFKVWKDSQKEKVELFYSTHSNLFSYFPYKKQGLMVHDLSAILFPQWHTFKVRLLAGKFFLGHALQQTDFVTTPSQATAKDLQILFPFANPKITVIYNGGSDKEILTKEENRFDHFTFPYFLYVGTLEPRKNIPRLLDAFSKAREKASFTYKLVIAGKKGWLFDSIFNKVKELHLENEVIFTDYVNETEKEWLYEHCNALLFPSLYEGFGLPVLHAMKKSVLVLASNSSSIPEVLPGNYPFLINPEMTADICEKLIQLSQLSVSKRKEWQEKLKQKADEFSWKKNATKWLSVIGKL